MDADALRETALFAGMSADEVAAAAEHFEEVMVRVGDELTHEDDFGYSFFVVLEGHVTVRRDDETLAELGPGDHFGEVALVQGQKRNATVKAAEYGRVAKMMIWDFRELVEKNPVLAARIQQAAEQRE